MGKYHFNSFALLLFVCQKVQKRKDRIEEEEEEEEDNCYISIGKL